MENPIKNSTAFAVIGVCFMALFVVFSQMVPQPEIITDVVEERLPIAQVNPTATFTLSPTSSTVAQSGQVTVAIMLNTGGQAIYGVDINRLRFNPAILQVIDERPNEPGDQIAPGSLMSSVFLNAVDNVAGTVQFSQVINPDLEIPYNGSGVLATIRFQAVGGGTSNVTIDFTPGSGIDSNVATLGGDILASVGSGAYTVTTPDSTVPTAPGSPVLTVLSHTQINVAWAASTDAVGVTGYKVERCSGQANCSSYVPIASPAINAYSDTGLIASTLYKYRVRAFDAAGNNSSYSSATSATTQPPPDTTPPTISNLVPPTTTATGATISWTTTNDPSDTQVEYGLTTSYGLNSPLNATLSTSHAVTLSGLSAGTTYHYRVKSRDAAGNLGMSSDNIFTTTAGPDTTIPNAPTGLTVSPTSETQIQLSWTAATDPIVAGQTRSGVVSYQIFRNNVLLSTSATTAYLDTGLTGGTAYSYQVTAVDGAGLISTKSAAVVGTTPTLSLAVQRRVILNLEGAPATKRNVTGTIEFLNTSFQASITTDALGQYTMSVPAGLPPTVTLRASIPGYLSRLLPDVDLRDTTVLDARFPQLLAGDFDSNRFINTLDFSYMNIKWGGADVLADINKDGAVNSLDFSFLSANWIAIGE